MMNATTVRVKKDKGRSRALFLAAWSLWLALAVLLLWSRMAAAQTIRVGYYMFDGYQMETPEQVRSGYGYDFLQELARYTGWDYEYVGYELGWAKLQEMLDEGQIDILTSARRTPERDGKYLFSAQMGTSAGLLTVKSGSTRITVRDYQTYQGIRVGMIKDSSINENFKRFAAERGFSYTPVYYLNADELGAALQKGEAIDAACTTNLRRVKNEWILEQFDEAYFYAMMRKDRIQLQKQMNDGIAQMDLYSSGWRTVLWNRYYKPDLGPQLALTAAEQDYVAQQKSLGRPLTVLINPSNAPYSSFVNGRADGIIPDIFNEIARRTGLDFRYLETGSREEYLQACEEQKADVVADATYSYDRAEKLGYRLTMNYLSSPISRISSKAQLDDLQILAVPAAGNEDFENYLLGLYPTVRAVQYPSMETCIKAVLRGDADVTYVYPYTAQKYLEENEGRSLRVTILPQYQAEFALAVGRGTDIRLLTTLNKAVASVKDSYTNQVILEQMAAREKTVSLFSFLSSHPSVQAGLIFLLFLLVLVVGISLNRQWDLRLIRAKNEELHAAVQKANEASQKAYEASQKATEASEAKSRFLSSMSHDMRTPLNGIIGFTGFALEESDPAKKQEDLLKIKQAGDILLDLINNTLDMSRIESGKFTLNPEPVTLQELLGKVIVVIEEAAAKKQQRFETQIDYGRPGERLLADRLKVQELVLNLLSNAVKYTPKGGRVRLTVTQEPMERDLPAQRCLRLVVADNGIGISREFLPHIFEAFAQEQDPSLSGVSGTGLGLSIVKRIIDLMQGTIQVQSQKGQGSTFTVVLPLTAAPCAAQLSAVTTAAENLAGLKVLLCEDNELNVEIATRLLESRQLQVTAAPNGQAGLEAFAASGPGEFALILMDVHMPVLDGLTATQKIRQLPGPTLRPCPSWP
jgi:signal transduction histidine kinase